MISSITKRRLAAATALALAGPAAAQVTVNGDGIFEVDATTQVTLDGVPVARSFLDRDGLGYRAQYVLAPGVAEDMSRGVLTSIDLRSRLRGPVTSLTPLSVLEQPVVITDDTLLRDIPGDDPGAIALGDILEVSGVGFADGTTEATLVRLRSQQDENDEWKVSGFASAVSPSSLFIGSLEIVVNDGTLVDDCDGGLSDGDFIKVEAFPVVGYQPGDALTAIEVECKDDRLDAPVGDRVRAEIEGVITEVLGPDSFMVGDQVIAITPDTRFDDGTAANIQMGIRVEVEGTLDGDTGVLTAREVDFEDDFEFEIEAPVEPEDLLPGESVTILGLTVALGDDVEDEDGIAQAGLSQARQLKVEGVVLPDGSLAATEIEDEGMPDPFDIELEGIVESVDAPTFVILGITVDAGAAEAKSTISKGNEELEIERDLINAGVYPLGSGDARYRERDGRAEFDIEIEDVPVGSYDFRVDGLSRGTIEVMALPDGQVEGELEFSNPTDDNDLLLTFDPRGKELTVLEAEDVIFTLDFPGEGGGDDSGCDDPSDDCDDDGGDGDDDDDRDDDGGLDAFFDTLRVGDRVEVDDATFDAQTNTLFAGEVEIDDDDSNDEDRDDDDKSVDVDKGNAGLSGVGLGTVTGSDRLFGSSFE